MINSKTINKIINLYIKEGLSQQEISEITNIPRERISRLIVSLGWSKQKHTPANKTILNTKQENEIRELFNNGARIKEICEKFNISRTTVERLIKDYKFKFNKKPSFIRKYEVNENYIDNLDSETKVHFLGFFYADGYNNGNTVSAISLAEPDQDYLKIISNIIQPEKPLQFIPKNKIQHGQNNQYRLTINSKHFSEKLTFYGAMKRKTFLLKFPTSEQVPEYLIHHFIRGYFDGDGCLSKTEISYKRPNKTYKYIRYMVNIAGTKQFLEGIKDRLDKLKISSYIKKHTNERIYYLCINSYDSVEKFLDFVYENATIYLQRKYDKMLEFREFNKNRPGTAKLNEKQVLEIRKLYKNGIKTRQLATQFDITIGTIRDVINKVTWNHI